MGRPGDLLLVVATAAEAAPLADLALDAELLVCGVGKVAAATATALRLADGGVAGVVACGVAGAYPGAGLRVGDVVVATEVAVLDEGLDDGTRFIPFARRDMPVPGTAWQAADPLLRSALTADDESVRTGRIATVSVCAGSARLARERAATGALCEAMEGAAVAAVAARLDLPFAEVRGISNLAGPREGAPFDLAAGAAAVARVVGRLVRGEAT